MLTLWSLILWWILTAVIILGNGLVIYLITTRRNLRTTTNWFVLSLAVADFVVGAISFPRYSLCRISQSCDADHVAGNVAFSVDVLFTCASVTNLCALTLDRYLAIVKPLRYATFMTKKRVALLIFAAWSVAFLVLVALLVMHLAMLGNAFKIMRTIVWMCIALLYLLVCVFLSFATVRIFLLVRKIARQSAALVAQLNFNHRMQHSVEFHTRETGSAKMLGIVVSVFVVCYTLDIVETILQTGFSWPGNETLSSILETFRLINYSVNPVAYAFYKREIRRELKRLLLVVRNSRFCNPTC